MFSAFIDFVKYCIPVMIPVAFHDKMFMSMNVE